MDKITRRWIAPVMAVAMVVGSYATARAQGSAVGNPTDFAPSATSEQSFQKGVGKVQDQDFELKALGIKEFKNHTLDRTKEVGGKGNPTATNAKPDVVFDITAKRYEFIPNVYRVKRGQVVLFRIHAEDNGVGDLPANFEFNGVKNTLNTDAFSGHGFYIQKYDVWLTTLHKGQTREVKLKAIWPGTYSVQCVVLCGTNHYQMHGDFIVE